MAIKHVSLVVLTVQNSALILTMRYSRTLPGPRYRATTAVLLSECLKSILAFIVLINSRSKPMQETDSPNPEHVQPSLTAATSHQDRRLGHAFSEVFSSGNSFVSMLVPAVLYTIQNNLQYMAATNLDAATFQVTYQGKILATAFFAVLILRQKLTFVKWFAILILTSGIVSISYPSALLMKTSQQGFKGNNRMIGLLEVGAACMTSGFAGVYLEYLLKRVKENQTESGLRMVWIRNLQLCFASVLMAAMGVVIVDGPSLLQNGFFHGYNAVVWYTILLQAGGGMVVALVIIHADNVLKNFATTISTVISTTISVMMGDCTFTAYFLCGVVLVLIATNLYGADSRFASPVTTHGKEGDPMSIQLSTGNDGVASTLQFKENGNHFGLLTIEESHEKV